MRPSVPSNRTDPPWPADAGTGLLPIARAAIAEQLGLFATEPELPEWVHRSGASFVTLHTAGRLRGCIGTISAYRSIVEDVRNNARNAAFRDPRFPAVSVEEYAGLDLEVSLLSPPQPMEVHDEGDLVRQLQPGVDGVLIEAGDRRGTFLPQVWEHFSDAGSFVAALRQKAGVKDERWDPDWRVSRYTVTAWSEP